MNIKHRYGGEITKIHAIGHETYRGVAEWFLVCDVKWDDTGETSKLNIQPCSLCYAEDKPDDLNNALALMNKYLDEQGSWHEQKRKRDGRVYSWTPHKPNGSVQYPPQP